jgi:hypothetical protein
LHVFCAPSSREHRAALPAFPLLRLVLQMPI